MLSFRVATRTCTLDKGVTTLLSGVRSGSSTELNWCQPHRLPTGYTPYLNQAPRLRDTMTLARSWKASLGTGRRYSILRISWYQRLPYQLSMGVFPTVTRTFRRQGTDVQELNLPCPDTKRDSIGVTYVSATARVIPLNVLLVPNGERHIERISTMARAGEMQTIW